MATRAREQGAGEQGAGEQGAGEQGAGGKAISDKATLWSSLRFNEQGLVAAIAFCQRRRCVLMQAWMNRAAIERTLTTREVTYFSRSRAKLWVKGESSGNRQKLKALFVDCDGDSLLLVVEQTGVACHTGQQTCFYRQANENGELEDGELLAVEHL